MFVMMLAGCEKEIRALAMHQRPLKASRSNTELVDAKAVAELRFGVLSDIDLHLLPKPVIVANFLAVRADREDAPQCLALLEGSAKLDDQALALLFHRLAVCDVALCARIGKDPAFLVSQ